MTFQLRIVDKPFPRGTNEAGTMWRYPPGDLPDRECWWIVLPAENGIGTPGHPGENSWRTTDKASSPPHELWTVTGVAPNLTVTPSIDVQRYVKRGDKYVREGSYWHGFITNGVGSP